LRNKKEIYIKKFIKNTL